MSQPTKTLETRDDSKVSPPPRIQQVALRSVRAPGELIGLDWSEAEAPQTRVGFWRRHWLFFAVVVLPVVAAILYFCFLASDRYVSEAQFLVRTASQSESANLAAFMQNQKISRASDETFAVAQYLVSRDAFRSLVDHDGLRSVLSGPGADFMWRFPNFYSRDTLESLYRHFLSFVEVRVDSESGIATLRVSAFTPADSQMLAKALLDNADALVNQLNTRLFDDSLRLAQKFVDEERAKLDDVETRLTAFRNAQNVIDPGKESTAALEQLGKMMSDLMQAESALSQEISEAPQSPHIQAMKDNVQALQGQVADMRAKISGDQSSLAGKLAQFDQLMLDRELAARGLGAAEARLITARQDLEQKQFYLQTVVEPGLPDQPGYPLRALDVAIVFGISMCAFGVLRVLLHNVAEHYT